MPEYMSLEGQLEYSKFGTSNDLINFFHNQIIRCDLFNVQIYAGSSHLGMFETLKEAMAAIDHQSKAISKIYFYSSHPVHISAFTFKEGGKALIEAHFEIGDLIGLAYSRALLTDVLGIQSVAVRTDENRKMTIEESLIDPSNQYERLLEHYQRLGLEKRP